MDLITIYKDINTLADLVDKTNGYESAHIELKAVLENLIESKPAVIGDFKLRIAKEMCAFANTDGGIIAIGIDETTKQVNNNTKDILNWFDDNIRHMLEPKLSGVIMKSCSDELGNEFLLMYVPKGRSLPYRTSTPKAYEKKKDIAREYYQRIGTHSERIETPIVRSLYLSRDRVTRIEATAKLITLDRPPDTTVRKITFGVEITPDPTKLIVDYYLESQVTLLDKSFNELHEIPIDIGWWSVNQPNIPPDDAPYIYNERSVVEDDGSLSSQMSVAGDDEYVPNWVIDSAYAAYIKTSFACEGVPKTTDHRIIVFGDNNKLNEDSWNGVSNWIDDKCVVVRYISFSRQNDTIAEMYAMENYIKKKGLVRE